MQDRIREIEEIMDTMMNRVLSHDESAYMNALADELDARRARCFKITPYTMATVFLKKNPLAMVGDVIGTAADYDQRPTLAVNADSPTWAAEKVWTIYQNIDDDHLTPDGERSMMGGDLLRVEDSAGNVQFYVTALVGFKKVATPEGLA